MFIPIIGRFSVTERMLNRHFASAKPSNGIDYLSIIENTLVYFLIGFSFEFLIREIVLWREMLVVGSIFVVIAPLEYVLSKRRPKLFHCSKGFSLFTFTWSLYHAYWFLVSGIASGSHLLSYL
jgi:hypothetical protein